jgi:transcriptional antiterminator NusG
MAKPAKNGVPFNIISTINLTREGTMWYVAQVQSGKELQTKDLCNQLIGKDLLIECFVPMYERLKCYSGKWQKKLEVLFPAYIFIQTNNINLLFHALKSIPKLTKILGMDYNFIPIDKSEEEFLAKFFNQNYIIEMSKGFIVGENVHILEGPMINFKGKIKKIDRHKRTAYIEIEMFGRKTVVVIGMEVIAKVRDEGEVRYS